MSFVVIKLLLFSFSISFEIKVCKMYFLKVLLGEKSFDGKTPNKFVFVFRR